MIEYYTSCNVFPVKLLSVQFRNNLIPPLHVKLHPTNRCNLKCSFCTFANRDNAELSINRIISFLEQAYSIGCRAITISGGGEPLLHPNINEIISYAYQLGISVGIVTNGTVLDKVSDWEKVVWCRVSFSDERLFNNEIVSGCDVGYSYIVTKHPNWDNLLSIVDFAERNSSVLYVIITLNVHEPDTSILDSVKLKIDSPKVKFLSQNKSRGCEKCLVSLLKPNLAPDGYLYPCSSVHQLHQNWPAEMRMGAAEELVDIYKSQRYFDGSGCAVCRYTQYNRILQLKVSKISHERFL